MTQIVPISYCGICNGSITSHDPVTLKEEFTWQNAGSYVEFEKAKKYTISIPRE